MAELLVSEGWAAAGSVGAYLREALPDEYIVVAEPVIYRCPMAAVVVGCHGLYIVLAADVPSGPDQQAGLAQKAKPTGRPVGPSASSQAEAPVECRESLQRFLRDEFPALAPGIHTLRTLQDWAEDGTQWSVVGDTEMRDQPLAEAIMALDQGAPDAPPPAAELEGNPPDAFASDEVREALGVALRDRRLTASQRASKPFVFRSGGSLRTGTRVWTVNDAARHMDRHPADGMHHLRDGTLAAWLEDEGAGHLAQLARDVINQPRVDLRVALESFLVDSGLAARPEVVFRPRAVDLGYVVQGSKAAQLLRLRKGRGRGYPFGELTGADPWLNVAPNSFQGPGADFVVTADTAGLPIDYAAQTSAVWVMSNAAEEAMTVPVSVRVVALPARANRTLLRPVAGMLVAALLGGLIGSLWHVTGVTGAAPTGGSGPIGGTPLGTLTVLLAAVWGFAGLLRGMRQPPAWPVRYALGRWTARAVGWSLFLAVLAVALAWAWSQGLAGGLTIPNLTLAAIAAIAAGFGFVPATLDELANARHEMTPGFVHGRHSPRRAIILGGAAVTLLLVALLTPRLAGPTVERLAGGQTADTAKSWVIERVNELDRTLDGLVDRLVVWYYKK